MALAELLEKNEFYRGPHIIAHLAIKLLMSVTGADN
jgi:hypothetical protein